MSSFPAMSRFSRLLRAVSAVPTAPPVPDVMNARCPFPCPEEPDSGGSSSPRNDSRSPRACSSYICSRTKESESMRNVSTSERCRTTSCANRRILLSSRVFSFSSRRSPSTSSFAVSISTLFFSFSALISFLKSAIISPIDFSRLSTFDPASLMERVCLDPRLAYWLSISCFSCTSRSSVVHSSSSTFFSRCNSSVSWTCNLSSSAMRRFCCRMRLTEASRRSLMSSSQAFLSSSNFCSYSFFIFVFCSMNLRSSSAVFTSCWCLSSSLTCRNRSISASISSWRSLKSLSAVNSFWRNST
mmetsp:Transcript_461/g.822  ORF Transcript_461/g.822 Transcript_461/m.822 type:complete len:300 (-) Transcript_461:676-1575(-)